MATFTENQVRQFYVATATGSDVITPVKVDSSHAATDLSAKSAGACQFVTNPAGDEMYLMYKGPSTDGVQRSDLIKKCNVISVKGTAAADLKHKMKRVEVTLDSSVSATPVVGQDYMLNFEILNRFDDMRRHQQNRIFQSGKMFQCIQQQCRTST